MLFDGDFDSTALDSSDFGHAELILAAKSVQAAEGAPNSATASAASGKNNWKPWMLRSRKELERAFRDDHEATTKKRKRDEEEETCYFCCNPQDHKYHVDGNKARLLKAFAEKYYGQMRDKEFVEMMHARYEALRIYTNMNLKDDQLPLPLMSKQEIYEHFKKHTHDIQTKLMNRAMPLQETFEELMKAPLKKIINPETGEKSIVANWDNIRAAKEILAMELMIHKADPSKMLCYNNNSKIDFNGFTQGNIQSSHKRLISHHESKKK